MSTDVALRVIALIVGGCAFIALIWLVFKEGK